MNNFKIKVIVGLFCLAWLVYSYSEGIQYGRAIGRCIVGVLILVFLGFYMLISNWRNKKHQKNKENRK